MSEQVQKERPASRQETEEVTQEFPARSVGKTATKGAQEASSEAATHVDEIDAVLDETKTAKDIEKLFDEIDEVLEQDAQEFVDNFKQIGGQ